MENNTQQENENQAQNQNQTIEKNKKTITPQEVQFYFKASWYLLAVLLISEFTMMFITSKVEWGDKNLVVWVIRIIIFGYIFYRIARKFKKLNLGLFGSILGFETGLIVAISKIILNSGAQWTWFNLLTEPFYLMGLGTIVGFAMYSLNNTKRS